MSWALLFKTLWFKKLLISLLLLIIWPVLHFISNRIVRKRIDLLLKDRSRQIFFHKLAKTLLALTIFISILSVWLQNPWAFLVGILGVIAIGFIAVWSLLGNILAGLIILALKLFAIGDTISVLPEEIKGRVVDYDYFFLHMQCEDGSIIYLPHTLVFQRMIKKLSQNNRQGGAYQENNKERETC